MGGDVGGVTPPLKTSCRQMKGFVGKRKIIYHKTLSYIRFTVGQYWLIIKKNGTNSVNFVRNFVISGKFVLCLPLKWYTDRGGGRSSKIIFFKKNYKMSVYILNLYF